MNIPVHIPGRDRTIYQVVSVGVLPDFTGQSGCPTSAGVIESPPSQEQPERCRPYVYGDIIEFTCEGSSYGHSPSLLRASPFYQVFVARDYDKGDTPQDTIGRMAAATSVFDSFMRSFGVICFPVSSRVRCLVVPRGFSPANILRVIGCQNFGFSYSSCIGYSDLEIPGDPVDLSVVPGALDAFGRAVSAMKENL